MIKSIRIRNKLREVFKSGKSVGEINASKQYRKTIKEIRSEHSRQIKQLLQGQKREIKAMEKEYNIKITRLDKLIDENEKIKTEQKESLANINKIRVRLREILIIAQEREYHSRKNIASTLDDARTADNLVAGLSDSLKKTTLAKELKLN